MRFPLNIKKTLVLDRRIYGISSEGYLLNIISDYMKQFKMSEKRSDNYLHYRKQDVFRGMRAKDAIRNVVIRVEVTETDVRITIELQTIIELAIIVLPLLVFPFIMSLNELYWFIPTVLGCGVFIYLTRYTILIKLYKELRYLTSKLKRI